MISFTGSSIDETYMKVGSYGTGYFSYYRTLTSRFEALVRFGISGWSYTGPFDDDQAGSEEIEDRFFPDHTGITEYWLKAGAAYYFPLRLSKVRVDIAPRLTLFDNTSTWERGLMGGALSLRFNYFPAIGSDPIRRDVSDERDTSRMNQREQNQLRHPWIRISGGGHDNDNWYYPDEPITIDGLPGISGPGTVTGYSYWDSESFTALELGIPVGRMHTFTTEIRTQVGDNYSYVDVDVQTTTVNGSYRHTEVDLDFPGAVFLGYRFNPIRWVGVGVDMGYRMGILSYLSDDEIFSAIFDKAGGIVHHWSVSTVLVLTLPFRNGMAIDASFGNRWEVADLRPIFGDFKSSKASESAIGLRVPVSVFGRRAQ